ncbi:MAG: SDR family NAD(P)-dependent oxidoreductase [Bacteroidales bacterium]|jgi:glycerol-3-phosphate cytidylyltransferase|nr:SDR family NAD(P)-dependent oxidoreductase [Bacteroidales bacterium]
MKQKALVVGGSNGIGLALAQELLQRNYGTVYVIDKTAPAKHLGENVVFFHCNLLHFEPSVLQQFADIDTLIITAGFGRVADFSSITDAEIVNSVTVNAEVVCRIIKFFYEKIQSTANFHCAVMGSIAGLVSSPLFAVYGATKSAVCKFIESVNIELEQHGTQNRILNVSPGSIAGTRFNGGENDLEKIKQLAQEILEKMYAKQTLFIPQFEEIYETVLRNYTENPHEFGVQSYKYKQNSTRKSEKPQLKIGYLSGTFDLFHIGHLNLLRRAKEYCDYLVVGVHRDALHKGKQAFIPFEERFEIVKNIKYVDNVVASHTEDIDAYAEINYDFLFVGSDYKGSERFNRYEEFFKHTDVKIIYFPYTQSTSSTQLRTVIDAKIDTLAQ